MFTIKDGRRYTSSPKTMGFDGCWAGNAVLGSGPAKGWAKGANDKE